MPKLTKTALLKKIADDQGFAKVMEMLNHFVTKGSVPGACTTCGLIVDSCEPDADDIPCEECDTNTVVSIMQLAEVI